LSLSTTANPRRRQSQPGARSFERHHIFQADSGKITLGETFQFSADRADNLPSRQTYGSPPSFSDAPAPGVFKRPGTDEANRLG
jgi:hypothetical protein